MINIFYFNILTSILINFKYQNHKRRSKEILVVDNKKSPHTLCYREYCVNTCKKTCILGYSNKLKINIYTTFSIKITTIF